jgi:hypothetical protein
MTIGNLSVEGGWTAEYGGQTLSAPDVNTS